MFENGQLSITSSQTAEPIYECHQRENFLEESNYKKKKKLLNISGDPFKTGRWTHEEHQKFVEAIFIYGNDWKIVQKHIGTRTSTQARSHAQKFLIRLKKKLQIKSDNEKVTLNTLDNLSNDSVQSCLKEFIAHSNGSYRQIDREKLFKVILSFSNLLYFKSKKKDKKLARFPILESNMEQSKFDKEKRISFFKNEISTLKSNSNKIFLIEKINKDSKFSKIGQLGNEIKILVEEKNILSTNDKSNKKSRTNIKKRNYFKKIHNCQLDPSNKRIILTNEKGSYLKEGIHELKTNDTQNFMLNNFNKPFSVLNNNCITNVNTFGSNHVNQTLLVKPNQTKLNYNVYDNLLQYYGNNKRCIISNTYQDDTSDYLRNYKLSNASTVDNFTDCRPKEQERKIFLEKEDINLGEMKIFMQNDNNYEDLNSYIPNNFCYNHINDINVKLEDDAFEKFFDFK